MWNLQQQQFWLNECNIFRGSKRSLTTPTYVQWVKPPPPRIYARDRSNLIPLLRSAEHSPKLSVVVLQLAMHNKIVIRILHWKWQGCRTRSWNKRHCWKMCRKTLLMRVLCLSATLSTVLLVCWDKATLRILATSCFAIVVHWNSRLLFSPQLHQDDFTISNLKHEKQQWPYGTHNMLWVP